MLQLLILVGELVIPPERHGGTEEAGSS
ncbi:uncharacterized protein METZ01_LOCUS26131 [marine metagenome]|uniref:Uncharacterized protein n=1 Tax=marine metagenome TaxID=408172 RepID=A0A381Q5B3_9ZZZZ